LLRAERAWFAAPGTDPSVRVRTAFVASCAAHLLLGIALAAVVWRAMPAEPAPAAVSVVFEAPADQPAAPAVQPGPTAAEPSQSDTPVQEPTAAVPPDSAEAAPVSPAAEPTPEPSAAPLPDRVEQPPPVAAAPEPAPEPPSPPPPSAPPPSAPPVLQVPALPPPLVPHSKPPAKQIAARPPAAKPTAPPPGPAATAPAEPATSGAPTAPQSPSPAVAGWNTLFSAWLAARKTYPEAARQHGEQGSVTLRFRVAVDGTVLEVALVTGSGSPVLDEAARALLRGAKLPPPQVEISRTVRLRYRLDD
jgi:TonB family protein